MNHLALRVSSLSCFIIVTQSYHSEIEEDLLVLLDIIHFVDDINNCFLPVGWFVMEAIMKRILIAIAQDCYNETRMSNEEGDLLCWRRQLSVLFPGNSPSGKYILQHHIQLWQILLQLHCVEAHLQILFA